MFSPLTLRYSPCNNISFQCRHVSSEGALGLHSIDEKYLTDTFVKIAKVDSACDPHPTTIPSTPGQKTMAKMLAKELQEIPGVTDVKIDPKTYVVSATLPHNLGKNISNVPAIGFIAHMDTSPDVPTHNIFPIIHKNYEGGKIHLPKDLTIIQADSLKNFKGEDIITSDGSTLLGADDKAGIVEILEALRLLGRHPAIKHPTVRVAFTPDEENAFFIEKFDIKGFGADAAYTLDGSRFNEIDRENFNGKSIKLTIHGKNSHPGDAKGKMINSLLVAKAFLDLLPKEERPETTEGMEGYYYCYSLTGNTEKTNIIITIRDYDYKAIEERYDNLKQWAEKVEQDYPGSKIDVEIVSAYENAKKYLDKKPEVLEFAKKGLAKTIDQVHSDLIPEERNCRGRTDGATLATLGLPATNLGAGGQNFHAKNEFVSIQEMARCSLNIVNILSEWVKGLKGINDD